MSELFSAICVGGPYDGQRYTHWRDTFEAAEFEPLPCNPPCNGPMSVTEKAARRHTYVMEHLQFGRDGTIPFWVSGMTPKQAVERVFAAYRGKDGQKT